MPRPRANLMTWTWALMMSVSSTVKPSSTLLSSMNFFQPQSCSFLQKRCSVSAHIARVPGHECTIRYVLAGTADIRACLPARLCRRGDSNIAKRWHYTPSEVVATGMTAKRAVPHRSTSTF